MKYFQSGYLSVTTLLYITLPGSISMHEKWMFRYNMLDGYGGKKQTPRTY